MMRGFFTLLLVLASACQSAPGPARLPPAVPEDFDRAAAALDIVHRSGLDAQLATLASVGEVWRKNLERVLTMLPEEERPPETLLEYARAVSKAAAAPYEAEPLARRAQELVAAGSATDLHQAQAWYASDEAEELALLRAELSTGAGQQRLARFLARSRSEPPSQKAIARAERVVDASRELDLVILMTWDASRGFARSLSGALPQELAGGPEEEGEREAFANAARRQVLWRTLFAHAHAGEAAADKEHVFWQSASGRWWATARLDAVRRLLLEAETKASALATAVERPAAGQMPPSPSPDASPADGKSGP